MTEEVKENVEKSLAAMFSELRELITLIDKLTPEALEEKYQEIKAKYASLLPKNSDEQQQAK